MTNTIPSISSAYTVVGGTRRAASTGLSAVLLNRGGRYTRRLVFQELEKTGFDYVISVEGPKEHYDIEELSGRFPFVRFIMPAASLLPGEALNLAAREIETPAFFALWNDCRIFNGGGAPRYAEQFAAAARLCTVPVIQNSSFENYPTLVSLYCDDKKIGSHPTVPEHENQASLYPWDFTGVYDREKFQALGGFDAGIVSQYWQLMDFGFRAHLFGEEIKSTLNIHLVYDGAFVPDDARADASYRLFWLKNIAPDYQNGAAAIPLRRFPGFLARTGWDILTAADEFARARKWVKENGGKFKCGAQAVLEKWAAE